MASKARYLPSARCCWDFKLCFIPFLVKCSLPQGWRIGGLRHVDMGCTIIFLYGGCAIMGPALAPGCWRDKASMLVFALYELTTLDSILLWEPTAIDFPTSSHSCISFLCSQNSKLTTRFEQQHFQHWLLQVPKQQAGPWAQEQNPQTNSGLSRRWPAIGPVLCWAF